MTISTQTKGVYSKEELLMKMGTVGVSKFKDFRIEHCERGADDVTSFASVKFEQGDRFLRAESSVTRKVEDTKTVKDFREEAGMFYDASDDNENPTQHFELVAEKEWITGDYRIKQVLVDGEVYPVEDEGLVELSLSIFYARLVEIEIMNEEKIETYSFDDTQADMVRDVINSVLYGDDETQGNIEMHKKAQAIHARMPMICFDDRLVTFIGAGSNERVATT